MAQCKFCGKSIVWMKEGRKNTPVEEDGTPHTCKEMQDSRKSLKKIEPTSLSKEEIARYEAAINEQAEKAKKKKKY
ncbi:MAG: hypothetical protein HN509_15325 [Halobacteriovoraceae bacterium]|nr:hypothetical protein [Halobacteriovoraceae bacterium]MBT5093174.1 hypothetical protein [Halobacteriovoraceae bacterium]